MGVTKPYEFIIGLGAMVVTKTYKFIRSANDRSTDGDSQGGILPHTLAQGLFILGTRPKLVSATGLRIGLPG